MDEVSSAELPELLKLSSRNLEGLLCAGHVIDTAALDGRVYRGVSLGLPGWLERLTWKTFQKTFFRDPDTGILRGWNIRLEQRGLDAPSVPLRRRGAPHTFGHYEVVNIDPQRSPIPCPQALLIDYGRGGGHPLNPTSRLRDPLVSLHPGRVDRLLGCTYLDLGFTQLRTPSYFLLTDDGPLEHVVDAP